jgi:3-oxoacyl-[acyl-carrier-protein] synthase-3
LFEFNYEGLDLDEYLRSDGVGRDFLRLDAGGSLNPTSKRDRKQYKTKTVFKYAVTNMADLMN